MDENMKRKIIVVIALVVLVLFVEGFKFIKSKIPSQDDINNIQNIQTKKEPEYTINDMDIVITVLEDGTLNVEETIVYNLLNDSDKVYRNYTVEKFAEKSTSYQPEVLGISQIVCNGQNLYEEVLTNTGIIINKDKKTGVKKYTIEYVLEDAVEKCNNVSEFLCNLNLGTFEKEVKDLDITIKADNGAKVLDAVFLGKQQIEFTKEEGILKASLDRYLPKQSLWVNVKLENEAVPNTNRIMIEDRSIDF